MLKGVMYMEKSGKRTRDIKLMNTPKTWKAKKQMRNNDGISDNIPSWNSFRLYYYRHFHNNPQKEIAREGLTNYQRNIRPLHGSTMQYRKNIGCDQIDETQGDI